MENGVIIVALVCIVAIVAIVFGQRPKFRIGKTLDFESKTNQNNGKKL